MPSKDVALFVRLRGYAIASCPLHDDRGIALSEEIETNSEIETRRFEIDRFRRMGERADVWALLSESTISKEIYARVISNGELGFEELLGRVAEHDFRNMDLYWLGRFARIMALQPNNKRERDMASTALGHCVDSLPMNNVTLPLRKLLVELYIESGQTDAAKCLLESDVELVGNYYGYLRADAHNPFLRESCEGFSSWLEDFNRPFVAHGVAPVDVTLRSENAFNTLRANVSNRITAGPLVSVILTTFNPDPEEIRTSVQSILRQTWQNLELLIVDDSSHANFTGVLYELRDLDPRVRLIRLPNNGGTYRARNVGLKESRGYYVTGQDTDDWSHPERIARQVKTFENQPSLPAVMVSANRMDDNLVRAFPGFNPHRRCEVSLMVRRTLALGIGGYLPVRKAADSEFRERLEAAEDAATHTLPDPLYLIRMSPGSLSRSDFRPGWSHHARRSFWSAYKHWHSTATEGELTTDGVHGGERLPFVPPPRILGNTPINGFAQLGFVCDWRGDSSIQRAALDEIRTALYAGLSVALVQLESPHTHPLSPRSPIPEVQQLINEGKVTWVSTEDQVTIELLIVRDPASLDYARDRPSRISVMRSLIVADDNMLSSPTSIWNYSPKHAHTMTRSVFQVEPIWALLNVQNRFDFHQFFGLPTAEIQYSLVVRKVSERRRRLSPTVPVIGRAALNVESDWTTAEVIKRLYPVDGTADVRVLGDARGAVREMRERLVPANWVSFRDGEICSHVFWRSVEFNVEYSRRGAVRALDRSTLEAMAAGCLVIMDSQAKSVYGDAIEGVSATGVPDTIMELRNDVARYHERTERAQSFLRTHSAPKGYLRCLSQFGIKIREGQGR